ncbi:hypothetical protein LOTGIDRAFT_227682 [Lottia gigantea]|uniref:GST N-terminal domain-containing protein n=1 Tax=Lottia gigantea TaxID=225164 RepID=V4CK54_LOTGI|nr:hypothetical protein LOTGIDRAFT_227682 [Lottia gigantea]ESP02610.1 hypothetical protein LOTGIDRAFT_227682 [Lottia gigantea]
MPKYTYYYFNIRGRGELPRLIFAAAGVQYENKRLEFADWPKLKEEAPLGSLPILDIDGKKYPESIPISRYLAREFGLDGKNNIEKLQTDVIVEECIQIREDQFNAHFEKDETIKAEKQKKLTETTLPKILGFIEKALSENARGNGFVVGNQVGY